MGAGELEGDMAYGAVDVGMSIYGVARLVRRTEAWRLFRYVRADYVRSYRQSGGLALGLDAAAGTATLKTLYTDAKKHDE